MMDPANSGLTGLTGSAADGKVKVELGDDPARKGDYSFGFTVYNLSDEDITFDVNTEMFTQAVAGEFMSSGTAILSVSATKWWAPLDGSSVPNEHDVNKDGRTDELDATAILDYVSGEKEADELNLTVADLDGDTDISSQDAYLLLGFAAEQGSDTQDGLVPAHGSRYCAVRITLPAGTKGDLDGSYPGGAFLEGFTALCIDLARSMAASTPTSTPSPSWASTAPGPTPVCSRPPLTSRAFTAASSCLTPATAIPTACGCR